MGSCCSISHGKYNSEENPIKDSQVASTPKRKVYNNEEIAKITTVDVNVQPDSFVRRKTGKINQEYKFLGSLGKGGFGEVKKAVHKASGVKYAVKLIKKLDLDEEEKERMINEVELLKKLDHPNIIKVKEFYEDLKYFYIVTELCTGGELFDRILENGRLMESDAADIMKQVFSAVFYCHKNHIVHRDLKPENILYESIKEDAPVKIIDFGVSREFKAETNLHQRTGTAYYIAPEVLKKNYNEKCDLWACGVILYIILCGYPPFEGSSEKAIMEKIVEGKYRIDGPDWEDISNGAKNMIKKLLAYDPNSRISAEQALKDEWIQRMSTNEQIKRPLAEKAFKNLKNFRANNKIQNAIYIFLVNFLSSSEEKNEMLSLFKALDLNGDGLLTKEELMIGYKKILNVSEPEEEVNEIMARVDQNNSGYIDYTEFVLATINRQKVLSKQRLEKAFKMFDQLNLGKDGNGSITSDELMNVFKSTGIEERYWEKIVHEIDPNGDGKAYFFGVIEKIGKITLKEFQQIMSEYYKEDLSKKETLKEGGKEKN